MAIVKVDARGRMTIPKEIGVKNVKAVIIPAAGFFVTVPLPGKPHEYAGSWLSSKRGKRELKALSEKSAYADAVERARRRGLI
jgi:bifunctional DNA-binding transcriptional regulator/antitoxin component of YhaV-PrlF toxin-antitoxin module